MNATQNPAKSIEKRIPRTLFYIEVTDTYGGEANYSWVTRHIIRASTALGAAHKFGRMSGYTWRKDWDSGDSARYNSQSGATCYFLSHYDHTAHSQFMSYQSDERTDEEKQGCIDASKAERAAYSAYLAGFESGAEIGPLDYPTWKANQAGE